MPALVTAGRIQRPEPATLVVPQLRDLGARPLRAVRRIPRRLALDDRDARAADVVLDPVVVGGRALRAVRRDAFTGSLEDVAGRGQFRPSLWRSARSAALAGTGPADLRDGAEGRCGRRGIPAARCGP